MHPDIAREAASFSSSHPTPSDRLISHASSNQRIGMESSPGRELIFLECRLCSAMRPYGFDWLLA